VANDSGFVDQSHLTRHFRKWVGVTPGAYARAVIA
jgi:AraC-like DNA-binding protein